MKLNLFTSENVDLLYLSPYALRYQTAEKGQILLRQELFGTTAEIPSAIYDEFLKRTEAGISFSELVRLSEEQWNVSDSEKFVRQLMAKGILE